MGAFKILLLLQEDESDGKSYLVYLLYNYSKFCILSCILFE